jgi:hypothetical protein
MVLPALENSPYYLDNTGEKVFIDRFLPSNLEEYGDALWQLPLTAEEVRRRFYLMNTELQLSSLSLLLLAHKII